MKWFDKAIAWVTYNAECEEVTALVTETKRLRSELERLRSELEVAKEKLDSKALALESADYASRQLTRKLRDLEMQRELDSTKYLRGVCRLEAELKTYRTLAYAGTLVAFVFALIIAVNWSNL